MQRGKLLNFMGSSRPEIYNSVQDLSIFITFGATEALQKAIKR